MAEIFLQCSQIKINKIIKNKPLIVNKNGLKNSSFLKSFIMKKVPKNDLILVKKNHKIY